MKAFATFAFVLAASVLQASAGTVTMNNLGMSAPPGTSTVLGAARWGRTGFEGQLQTFAAGGAIATNQNLNPTGTPVWSTTEWYSFKFEYVAATGTSSMKIDFNRDAGYGTGEVLTNANANLIGKTFTYVDLWQRGSNSVAANQAHMRSLTVNGFSFADEATNTTNHNFHKLFQDSSGQFGANIVVEGQFKFSGGAADAVPSINITLRDAVDLLVIPLPTASLAGLAGLAGLGMMRRRNTLA